MARAVVYACALVGLVAAAVLTLTSLLLPRWLIYRDATPLGAPITLTLGLHRQCASTLSQCIPFPTVLDCSRNDSFCTLWRSAGYLMNLSFLLELVAGMALVAMMKGGGGRGWGVAVGLLAAAAVVQVAAMGVMEGVWRDKERFFVGWGRGEVGGLVLGSAVVLVGVMVGLMVAGRKGRGEERRRYEDIKG